MSPSTSKLVRGAAVFASVFCLAGGLYILAAGDVSSDPDDAFQIGVALYLIGKAFFVGPMLWLAAGRGAARQQPRLPLTAKGLGDPTAAERVDQLLEGSGEP